MSRTRTEAAGSRALIAGAVVLNAAAQALLVAGSPEPGRTLTFVLLALASIVALIAAIAFVASAYEGRLWPGARLVISATVAVLAVVLVSFVSPLLVPPAATVALLMLTAVAAGHRNPLDGFSVFRRNALRSSLAVTAAITLWLLCWLVSLLLGFFVTGPPASALTWLFFGTCGALLLHWFRERYRHAHV